MVSNNSVLVLGAGELGAAVLHALAIHPQRTDTITVLLRWASLSSSDSAKQAHISELESLGISILAGDIPNATEAHLASLFSPFDTIIGCSGMYWPSGTQLKLARAMLNANVHRYIPWQFGLDYDSIGHGSSQDLFTEQLDVRDLLRRQTKTTWVVISSGIFMSFLFEAAFGVVSSDRKTVRALGGWNNQVTVTTAMDIGKVVAEVVYAVPELNGVVFIAGETLTYERIAEVVENIPGTVIEREDWSIERLQEELVADPDNGMKKYRVVLAEGKGTAWDREGTFNARRGMSFQNVEEWVKANLK